MTDLEDLEESLRRARYLSLVTFRRTGAEVATPVWCAAEGEDLFVFSAGDAGKVKRLKNSARARLAVCDMRGRVLGPYREAEAALIDDPAVVRRALAALRGKYGWQMWLADTGARLSGRFGRRSYIRIRLANQPAGRRSEG